MTDIPDTRWKQRLENLTRTCSCLQEALLVQQPNKFERAGAVQFFELAFELSWKLMKDILEYRGFQDVNSPRAAIKTAYQAGLIQDAANWLTCLESRNLTSHVYNDQLAVEVESAIKHEYFPMIEAFREVAEAVHE
ncbi:MAG: nucleotidyltransferase substrate binding protein [Thermoguttaceae bacterium]